MKMAIGFALFFWLVCGVIGAWWLDELDVRHWKIVALGPITFAHSLQDKPVNIPES